MYYSSHHALGDANKRKKKKKKKKKEKGRMASDVRRGKSDEEKKLNRSPEHLSGRQQESRARKSELLHKFPVFERYFSSRWWFFHVGAR